MSKNHHNDGPTFTPLSTKKKPRRMAPSPERQSRELDDKKREAAEYKRIHQLLRTNPAAAVDAWEKKKR